MAHLLSDLKAKDAFTVLEYCLGKDEPVLRERALQLIHDFSKEALESLAFFNASHAAVQLVYLQNPHSVSEIFLFKAVINLLKKYHFLRLKILKLKFIIPLRCTNGPSINAMEVKSRKSYDSNWARFSI
jgi:hypothetical protein